MVQIMAMKATEENKRLDKVRAAGFPLSETLVRVAGATRGTHRRLDLGRARAFADRIDLKPLEAVRESLANNLSQLLQFEKVRRVPKAEIPARQNDIIDMYEGRLMQVVFQATSKQCLKLC